MKATLESLIFNVYFIYIFFGKTQYIQNIGIYNIPLYVI